MKRYIRSGTTAVSPDFSRDMWNKAHNPNTNPTELAELANVAIQKDNYGMKSELAKNPSTPIDVLSKLAGDPDITDDVAQNPSIPVSWMKQFAHSKSWLVREGVARNTSVTPEILSELANDPSDDVRALVASNPKTPDEILSLLSADDDRVSTNLIEQSRTSSAALAQVARKAYHYQDLIGVVEHPNVTPEIIDYVVDNHLFWNSEPRNFLGINAYEVYTAIIQSPKTSHKTLEKMLKLEDAHSRLAKYSTDPDILDKLSKICRPYMKLDIAKNPNTSAETLNYILKSRSKEIKDAVRNNPNYTPMT